MGLFDRPDHLLESWMVVHRIITVVVVATMMVVTTSRVGSFRHGD